MMDSVLEIKVIITCRNIYERNIFKKYYLQKFILQKRDKRLYQEYAHIVIKILNDICNIKKSLQLYVIHYYKKF